ncbi:hypothetical protein [Amphritea sp.]|uniref:hypothetical protein n=1 Tax=Amphritea sp. TaxID=1872502 RepID=UPI003D0A30D2
MASHQEMGALVNDLTQSLNSRNNDYLGYWATGQLYKLAKDNGVLHVKIDVLNGELEPFSDHMRNLVDTYREKLNKQLKARKINNDKVSSFILRFDFEQEYDPILHRWVNPGSPYTLSVSLTSKLGHIYSGKVGGYCKPHDKTIEQRRTGF